MLLVNFICLVLWLKYMVSLVNSKNRELLVKYQPYAILLLDVKFRHCYVVSTAGSFLLFRPYYQAIFLFYSIACHFSYLLFWKTRTIGTWILKYCIENYCKLFSVDYSRFSFCPDCKLYKVP